MDRYPERFTPIVTLGLASALVLTWSVMSLAYAYNRSLAHMNDSFAQRFMIESELDDLISTVDHLSIDLQAFLSTVTAASRTVYTPAPSPSTATSTGSMLRWPGTWRNGHAWPGYPRQSSRL